MSASHGRIATAREDRARALACISRLHEGRGFRPGLPAPCAALLRAERAEATHP